METERPSSARFAAALALLAGVLGVGLALRPVLPALGVAALLAYLLNPLVNLFTNRLSLSRSWAVRFIYLGFLLLLVNVPAWSGAFLINQIDELVTLIRSWAETVRGWFEQPLIVGPYVVDPARYLDALEGSLRTALETVPTGSLSLLGDVTTNLLWAIVALVVLYYLLKDGPRAKRWLVGLAPTNERADLAALLDETDAIWSRFLRIQVLMFVLLTVLMGAGTLLALGIYRAGYLGTSPLILIVVIVVFYTLLQQVDNLWLRPHFLGRSLQLHGGLVFVGLIAGLVVGGFLGALFAVPVIATSRSVGRYLRPRLYPPLPGGVESAH